MSMFNKPNRTNCEIDRIELINKFIEKLSQFLISKRSYLFIIHGPKQSGKKYLIYNLIFNTTGLKASNDYIRIRDLVSIKYIKNQLMSFNNKTKLIIIENISLVLLKNKSKLNYLFHLAKQNSKKLILILNNKIYFKFYNIILKQHFKLFKINFLNHDEITFNLKFNSINSFFISLPHNSNNNNNKLSSDLIINKFYSIFKKPKYFKLILKQKFNQQQELVDQSSQNQQEKINIKKLNYTYKLSSIIFNLRPSSLLLNICDTNVNNQYELADFIKYEIDNQFEIKNLNQFISDLNCVNKHDYLKKTCYFIIISNRYDLNFDIAYLNLIEQFHLKLIFILNDLDLFNRLKHLFKFKFKFKNYIKTSLSNSTRDILVESYDILNQLNILNYHHHHDDNVGQHLDHIKIDESNLILIETNDDLFNIENYFTNDIIYLKLDVKCLDKYKNELNDLEKFLKFYFNLTTSSESNKIDKKLTKLIINYMIRKKCLIIYIDNDVDENRSKLVQDLIDLIRSNNLRLVLKFSTHFRNYYLNQFFKYDYYMLNKLPSNTHSNLHLVKEVTNLFESSLTCLNGTNIYLKYYFELKRLQIVSFNQLFMNNFKSIRPDKRLDDSLKSVNGLLNKLEYYYHDSSNNNSNEVKSEFKFNKKIYEYYFSSFYLIKELIIDNDEQKLNDMKLLITRFRYFKKYSLVWHLIAEYVTYENSYLKSLSLNVSKCFINFWRFILDDTNVRTRDLIGAAHFNLINECLKRSDLTNTNLFNTDTFKQSNDLITNSNLTSQTSKLCNEKNNKAINDLINETNKNFDHLLMQINDYLSSYGNETLPIHVNKLKKLFDSISHVSRTETQNETLFKFLETLIKNESNYTILTSSLIEANLIELLERLNRSFYSFRNQSMYNKSLFYIIDKYLSKECRFRTRFSACKSLINLGVYLNTDMFKVITDALNMNKVYLDSFNLKYESIDMLNMSSIKDIHMIELVFKYLTNETDELVVKSYFNLLGNSIYLANEIQMYKFDMNCLNQKLHVYYLNMIYRLNKQNYLNIKKLALMLVDRNYLILSNNNNTSNLFFKLNDYVKYLNIYDKNELKCELFKNIDLILNSHKKLSYLVDSGLLNLNENLIERILKLTSLNNLYDMINLLVKYKPLSLLYPILIDRLITNIQNMTNTNDDYMKYLINSILPCMCLMKSNFDNLMVFYMKLIMKKFMNQNNQVFRSINYLLIELVKYCSSREDNSALIEIYFDLVEHYLNEFNQYKKCFKKKKNLFKLKEISTEIQCTINAILNSIDFNVLIKFMFRKFYFISNSKTYNHNDIYLRFIIKKCILNSIAVLCNFTIDHTINQQVNNSVVLDDDQDGDVKVISENCLYFIDYDLVHVEHVQVDNFDQFLNEFSRIANEEKRLLLTNSFNLIINDQNRLERV